MTEASFKVVVPARYDSSRLPGKVLLDIAGKPMVQHVWERAQASGASDVIVATDDERVAAVARSFGAEVCMTSSACNSGTDRVAEVCRQLQWRDADLVVNVQGDAPLIPPASIQGVAELLVKNPQAEMATLCVSIKNAKDYLDPNVVKVVFDQHYRALYFSRSPVPAAGHGHAPDTVWQIAWRHLGLYAYRVGALQQLSQTTPCELEQTERLEQLRALWLGMTIMLAPDEAAQGPDVDTADDLLAVAKLLADNGTPQAATKAAKPA